MVSVEDYLKKELIESNKKYNSSKEILLSYIECGKEISDPKEFKAFFSGYKALIKLVNLQNLYKEVFNSELNFGFDLEKFVDKAEEEFISGIIHLLKKN